MLDKYGAGSNYRPKTKSSVINNNLSDYLLKSKYSKVLQLCYINKIMLFCEFQKGEGFDPRTPPGYATASNVDLRLPQQTCGTQDLSWSLIFNSYA